MKIKVLIIVIAVALNGCIYKEVFFDASMRRAEYHEAKIKAYNDMEKSKEEYKACLKKSSNNTEQCKALKELYEADVKTYRAVTEQGVVVEHQQ